MNGGWGKGGGGGGGGGGVSPLYRGVICIQDFCCAAHGLVTIFPFLQVSDYESLFI